MLTNATDAAAHRSANEARRIAEGEARHAAALADYAKAYEAMIAAQTSPDRDVRWRASKTVWAVLRKHKGFDRGGPQLDVYPLVGK